MRIWINIINKIAIVVFPIVNCGAEIINEFATQNNLICIIDEGKIGIITQDILQNENNTLRYFKKKSNPYNKTDLYFSIFNDSGKVCGGEIDFDSNNIFIQNDTMSIHGEFVNVSKAKEFFQKAVKTYSFKTVTFDSINSLIIYCQAFEKGGILLSASKIDKNRYKLYFPITTIQDTNIINWANKNNFIRD